MKNRTQLKSLSSAILILTFFQSFPVAWQMPQDARMAQAMAKNAQALKHYSWTMRVEVSIKGEVKSTTLYKMRYDIDGKVQKTQVDALSQEQGRSGVGRRGRRRARRTDKKIEEFKQRINALNQTTMAYVYAHPAKFQEFLNTAQIWEGRRGQPGTFQIEGDNFLQPGDSVQMLASRRGLVKMDVQTRFDSDPLRISADYGTIPDGPSYVARTVTNYPEDQIVIKVENFDYIPSGGNTYAFKTSHPTQQGASSMQRGASSTAQPASGAVSLPAGTELQVRLAQPLSSERNQSGQAFEAILDQDVTVGGRTVFRRGSRVIGTLVEVKESGKVSGKAGMSLKLTQLYSGLTPLPILTDMLALEAEGSKGRDAKRMGRLAGGGAIIGAIAGGGSGAAKGAVIGAGAGTVVTLATSGEELELGTEHRLSFRLSQPLQLPVR